MRWQLFEAVSLMGLLSLTSIVNTVGKKHPQAAEKKHPQPVEKNHQPAKEAERLDTAQMLQQHGYRVEEHYVVTEDGYVLRLFRIPPRHRPVDMPPVLVQHGLLSSSDDWVVSGPAKALAYLLADTGFDVWLGNGRGNVYSRHHVHLNTKHSKFWKFSWHEQGVYDIPAVIDHILYTTGHRDLFYMGHSMGTTMFFVMASEKPEYNKKIRAAFLMAPVAYMRHITSPLLKLFSEFEGPLTVLLEMVGVDEFEPTNEITKRATDIVCSDRSLAQNVCNNAIILVAGYNGKEINETMLPVYLAHSPAGASVRQLDHYAQEIRNGGHFRQFDFGPTANRERYGSRVPPDYRLSAATAPVALYYGNNDCLAREQDVKKAYKELKNPIGLFRVDMDEWSHLDFIWGIHAKELVYEKIFEQMTPFLHHPFNKTRRP
ncbi:lipase 3-like [Schistocerca americana]|uniref:lipase 3-like n=1 Tax=Schistocerca americana TaxID=7009 RepID=UPI001F4F8541|nr:lipase 3-like [Schistocerca americana]